MSRLVHISEAASLALHTMALLVREERRMTTQEIALAFKASGHHLAKVMRRLVTIGLVDSTRGPTGGFRVDRSVAETSLLEVFEAIEGPVETACCLFGRPPCYGDGCILSLAVRAAHEQLCDYLRTTTLAALAKGLPVAAGQHGTENACHEN